MKKQFNLDERIKQYKKEKKELQDKKLEDLKIMRTLLTIENERKNEVIKLYDIAKLIEKVAPFWFVFLSFIATVLKDANRINFKAVVGLLLFSLIGIIFLVVFLNIAKFIDNRVIRENSIMKLKLAIIEDVIKEKK